MMSSYRAERGEKPRCGLFIIHISIITLCWTMAKTDPAQTCVQHLSSMKCQHLAMNSLPSSLPDNLKTLDVSHNLIWELRSVSISHLHELEKFNIEHNHLETIENGALNTLLQLRSLNLASNRLYKHYSSHKGVLDSLHNLKRLNLANNNLDSDMVRCYLSNITSLVSLDLAWNSIAILFSGMFDGVPRLTELDLSNNIIAEIERGAFDSLQYLRVLNLAFNAISCISSFDLPQLHLLNLSSNSIQFFHSQTSHNFYQLRKLDLSQNSLVSFPILPENNMVQYLNLSRNNIQELFPLSNQSEENLKMASWYETIADVDLPSTIENIISHLTYIIELDLSYNQLTSFPWQFLSYISSLKNVNMAENCLHSITEVFHPQMSHQNAKNWIISLRSLRILDIHGNSISHIPKRLFDLMPEIEQINLKNNYIRFCRSKEDDTTENVCTTFSGARHLRYLNLQNNRIEHLPPNVFQHTPLYSLDLSDNIGLSIHEGALTEVQQSLQIMSLKRNLMKDSQTNLPCLKWLKTLDLSGNRLTVIPASLQCSAMESLNLQHNALRLVDGQTVLAWVHSLQWVLISGNPYDCCSLRWLNLWLMSEINILDLENTHCVYTDTNISVPINNTNIQSQYCRQHTTQSLLTIIVILIVCLLSVFCIITIANRKACLTRKFRSKVASEIPKHIKAMKSEGKQVWFTVSSKGTSTHK